MHEECLSFVKHQTEGRWWNDVLDVGGLWVNGTPRPVILHSTWTTLDIVDGLGVDIVADATTWEPERQYDLVLCLEVFEHAEDWPEICRTLRKATREGTGMCLVTAACPPRPPHDAYGFDGPPREGQYYVNVDPEHLRAELSHLFSQVEVEVLERGDVRARCLP